MLHPSRGSLTRPDVAELVRPSHHLVSHHIVDSDHSTLISVDHGSGGGSVLGLVVLVVCVLATTLVIIMVRTATRRQARHTEQEVEMVNV